MEWRFVWYELEWGSCPGPQLDSPYEGSCPTADTLGFLKFFIDSMHARKSGERGIRLLKHFYTWEHDN